MKNPYSKAIDIIGNASETDWKGICIELAKKRPALFLSCAQGRYAGALIDYRERCLELMKQGEKIQAIKLWRAETGASLAAAKEAVESL